METPGALAVAEEAETPLAVPRLPGKETTAETENLLSGLMLVVEAVLDRLALKTPGQSPVTVATAYNFQ